MTARWGTPLARRVLVTSVLGSSIAFIDGTVVNVALPHIGADLDAGLAGLQWVLAAYLVTLTALVLLGGVLGDRYGRRRAFLAGIYGFAAASLLCGVAPNIVALVVARALQGAAAALLVPGSLALLSAVVDPSDRPRAVGAWSGLTGVAAAAGPLVGGWLVDTTSWRWVFLVNLPLAAIVVVASRGIPDSTERAPGRLDLPGAAAMAAGLGLLTAGLIQHGSRWSVPLGVAGAACLVAFVLIERRVAEPMLPPSLFSSAQFSGANAVTFAVYAGLAVAFFLVVVDLQLGLGYSAVEAGAAMLPATALLLLLSARAGAAAQRTGPRLPMTVGPLLAAVGLVWLSFLAPGSRYVSLVLPGLSVFGLGLALTVAPLTAAVLAAVDERHLGLGAGVNNAVARLAGLLGVAVVPAITGLDLGARPGSGLPGYRGALLVAAGLCATGGVIALATIRRATPTMPTVQPSILHPCHDPCRLDRSAA